MEQMACVDVFGELKHGQEATGMMAEMESVICSILLHDRRALDLGTACGVVGGVVQSVYITCWASYRR